MKTFKYLTILLIAAIFVTSCKDEDEGTPRQMSKIYTYNQNLRGSEGVKGELNLPVLSLADVIGNDPARNLRQANMQFANTYLEITGLSEIEAPNDTVPVVLEDFTIKVGADPAVNLGDCTTDPQRLNEFPPDVPRSDDQVVNLIRNIFNDLTTGSKSAQITVSFTPNVSITSSDNVQLVISFDGTYHYLEFD